VGVLETLGRAFAGSLVGMAVLDLDGRFAEINPALCRMLGRTPDELLGRSVMDVTHPDDAEASARRVAVLPHRSEVVTFEKRYLHADGSVVHARVISSVAFGDDGRPQAIFSQIEDVTARRSAEEALLAGFSADVTGSIVRDGDGRPLHVITQLQDVSAQRRLREAERRFRGAFEDAGVPMALIDLDLQVLKVNAALCELFGHSEQNLLASNARAVLHPDEIGRAEQSVGDLLEGGHRSYRRDARYVHADGRLIRTSITASLVRDDDSEPEYVVVQILDVTAERDAQSTAELRLAQQTAVAWLGQRALQEHDQSALFETAVSLVAATLGASHGGLVLVGPGGEIRPATTIGWPAETPIAADPAASQVAYTLAHGAVIVDDVATERRFETVQLRAQGLASGMSVVVAGESQQPYGVLAMHSAERCAFSQDDRAFLTSVANVLTGALQRDAAARDLRHQSLHDPLTHLPNRALLLDRLRQGLARARRDGSTLAVLFCDLDDFKVVNDSLGHEAGDRLLATLAPRLQAVLRSTDTLARFGGDEFVVLCEGLADASEVVAVAERLLEACAAAADLGGTEFVPTASIGIAIAPPGAAVEPDALLRDADVAMYGAKRHGKGRYELFDARMRADTLERIALISDLRHAAARGELAVVFQPVVSLERRTVSGLETLMRWHHPERGLLMPDQFIRLAEDNGLIHEVGRWVLNEAVRHAAAWERAGTPVLRDAVVGVNVSWRQISHGTLVEDVTAALAEHRLDPRRLCLEVTESVLMEDPERSHRTFAELRQLGVALALDDFGTGHSSLSVLREFALDFIKLDRSFLAGKVDWSIVRAVCEMARSMDLLVVAEGIERVEHAERAHELGADFGQGWLYARPVAPDDLGPAMVALAGALRRGDVAPVA
jgi:diguanylate cyclase (GGDEF)-like protein/PAS domain S-box-containing protein